MSRFNMDEPWLIVTVEYPKKTKDKGIGMPTTAQSGERIFKRATVLHTFSELEYPIGSSHIMGEEEPIKIDYFGQKLLMTKSSNLYGEDTEIVNKLEIK